MPMNSKKLNEKRAARYFDRFLKRRPYISTEFEILDTVEPDRDYAMRPHRCHFVSVNDDLYLNNWYPALVEKQMHSYFNSLGQPGISLNRWGVTLIPPESLPVFLETVIRGPHYGRDPQLTKLADLLNQAIRENKFIIHYGV